MNDEMIVTRMPRLRTLAALFAVFALLIAACGDDDDNASADDDASTETSLDDDFSPSGDVAATVGSTEILVTTVESLYSDLSSSELFIDQMDEEGSTTRAMLRAQIVGQLVVQEVIVQAAADEFGIGYTDEDLEETFQEFAASSGGMDEFLVAMEESGLTRESLEILELPLATVLRKLEAEFVANAENEADADEPRDDEQPPQAALQEWAFAKLAEADVTVAPEYGTWDPAQAQVQPPGMTPPVSPEPEEVPAEDP